jgi:hypothetical protein
MNEEIISTVITGNETIALLGIEPLNCSCWHNCSCTRAAALDAPDADAWHPMIQAV